MPLSTQRLGVTVSDKCDSSTVSFYLFIFFAPKVHAYSTLGLVRGESHVSVQGQVLILKLGGPLLLQCPYECI